MAGKPPSDLLYDSEAALRLIDTALDELRGESFNAAESRRQELRAPSPLPERIVGLGSVTRVLAHAYADVMGALGSLRETRAILEHVAADRLKSTNDKLIEVSSATEVAATDILDGIERAIALVDSLARSKADNDATTIASLREELFRVMGCMQFQDITCQQLAHASSVLSDMERRLVDIARLFDPTAFGELALDAATGDSGAAAYFDSHASTKNAEARQAVADEVVNDMTDQDRKR